MTESDRDKALEVMARAAYAENDWWRTPADDDDGKGRYQEMGGVRMRAIEWDELDAVDRDSRLKEMAAAFTAYESHLQASGMAVVAKAWLDLFEQEAATWARVLPHPQAGNSDLRYLHSLAELRAMLAASPYGKAVVQEESAEARSAVANPNPHPQEKDA